VLGLSGSGLVLEDNGSDDLAISGTGTVGFTFKTAVSGAYNVIVKTQPAGQTCSVANGAGTATANVNTIQVTCAPTFTIGGTVSGLLGSGLTLQNNGGDNLSVNGTGTVNFTFATPLLAGATYAVTILNQPSSPAQNCVIANGSATVSGVVNNVQISCPQPKFSVGGNVTGLVVGPGDTMELQDNAGDNLFVTGDVPFTFPTNSATAPPTASPNFSVPAASHRAATFLMPPASSPELFLTCLWIASTTIGRGRFLRARRLWTRTVQPACRPMWLGSLFRLRLLSNLIPTLQGAATSPWPGRTTKAAVGSSAGMVSK